MSTELVPIPPADPLAPASAIGPYELLEHWLSGRSPRTVLGYRSDLADFARHAGRASIPGALARLLDCRPGEANAIVLGYRNALLERGLATSTVGRRLAALRSVVKLANTLGMVTWQLGIQSPRVEARRDVRGPDKAERKRLWKYLRSLGDGRKARRDRALVALLFDLGLRRGEVVALEVADFDQVGGTVAVLGKGHREKVRLTLPAPTRAALDEWLAVRAGGVPGPLFTQVERGDGPSPLPLGGHGLAHVLEGLGVSAGLLRRLRPHGLRHAAITAALDTSDIRKVRKFSRHAKLETVLKYDDAREDTAGEVADRVSKERK